MIYKSLGPLRDPFIIVFSVPDQITGAILGPKGKTLAEIQQAANCKVDVHKRGSGPQNLPAGNRLIRSRLSFIQISSLLHPTFF